MKVLKAKALLRSWGLLKISWFDPMLENLA